MSPVKAPLALAALALLVPPAVAALEATHAVGMQNSMYNPQVLQIAPGDTVVWTNLDTFFHTVTAYDGSFDSGDLGRGGTFTQTFDSQGLVLYHCLNHPRMIGVLLVL